ncbi:amidase family protein [Falsibacillus albus]|uniref:Amidase n=1 Tax=Falsibacillus albus TaxID=2478915 RepID=A0A3L7JVC7_9BACI|nr:amidase family protein [Falsibacillus albus]RLQ93621.1 amidase [Falsibacillus albus]
MSPISYKDYDGLGLAELVRKKEVQPNELVECAIQEIERHNPNLNAVIHKMYEQAKQSLDMPIPEGRFMGVPMLLKDITQEVKGEPITSGSRSLQQYRAAEDSNYVRKLREVGAIFLGQTNVPEFALMGNTEPAFYGPTKNPWNMGHTPGGSSGGSAAAVASGMVPIAGANDGGGSIRIPAAYCGLFGLKPTRGRTPVGPTVGRNWQGASVDHVLTRSVRDSAAMLDELSVHEKSAAHHAPLFQGSYLDYANIPLEHPMKIAFSFDSPLGTEVHPECREAVLKTVKMLESMGHHVEEKTPAIDGVKLANSYMMMYFGEVAAAIKSSEQVLGRKARFNDVEATTWILGLLGKSMSAEEFVLHLREWDKAAYIMEQFHETYDFYVTPTTAFPPAKIGELDPSPMQKLAINLIGKMRLGSLLKKTGIVDQLATESLMRTPFTQLANLTGQPAMSVPLHQTADGLPCGVQFMAARGSEHLLYQLAGELEESPYWLDFRENPVFQA